MKTLLPLAICLLFAVSKTFAQAETDQWKWNDNIRSEKIRWAPDAQNGILCAIGGCSYFTENGGLTWDCITTSNGISSNGSIGGAALLSANHMVVITQTLVFTTFTGNTHFASTLTPGHYCKDISFVDDNHGWVSCGSGELYRTTNGGATWTELFSVPGTNDLTALAFNSTTNGCVGTNTGKIYYSTNAGTDWTAATLPASVTGDITFSAIRYRNSTEVIACGYSMFNHNSVIIRSINGGQTWTTVHADIAEQLYDMDYRNSDTAFAVGSLFAPRNTNSASLIYQSVNGGQTWTELVFSSYGGCNFYGIDFANPSFGWISGWSCLYKFDDGSATGITEQTLAASACSIYPNPVNNKFHVSVSLQNAEAVKYQIADATGRIILKAESSTGEFDINAEAFHTGLYFIQIKSGNNLVVKKFSKQ